MGPVGAVAGQARSLHVGGMSRMGNPMMGPAYGYGMMQGPMTGVPAYPPQGYGMGMPGSGYPMGGGGGGGGNPRSQQPSRGGGFPGASLGTARRSAPGGFSSAPTGAGFGAGVSAVVLPCAGSVVAGWGLGSGWRV